MRLDSNIPTPKAGENITADWGRRMTDTINQIRVGGGAHTLTESSKIGTYISSRRPRVTEEVGNTYNMTAVPCRTTGEGSVLDGFEVEVYGDGVTRPYTHKDTMYILEIHAGAQIPANMWFLADVSVSQYLGGTN